MCESFHVADAHLKKWDKDGLLKGIEAGELMASTYGFCKYTTLSCKTLP